MTQVLPHLPLASVEPATSAATARTLRETPALANSIPLTPKAPGERSAQRPFPRKGACLGKGTVGLGPECNTQLKRCDREVQRRWLQTRTQDISRSRAERDKQKEVLLPKDRYTQHRSEVDRLKMLAEEGLEKVRIKNANSKKEAKEHFEAQRKEDVICKQERVKSQATKQKVTLQPLWQWQNVNKVWSDFALPDNALLEKTHTAFGEANKPLEVQQLCHPSDTDSDVPFTIDFERLLMTNGGSEIPIRRKLVHLSVQRGNKGSTDSLEEFRQLCEGLTKQMRSELEGAMHDKTLRTQEERDRKKKIKQQSGDEARALELRRKVQHERMKLNKKHKMLKDKGALHRENQRTDIQEERKLIASRKQDRLERQERLLELQYKEVKQRQQDDANRRAANTQDSLVDKKRAILTIKEHDSSAGIFVSGSIALSKGQSQVRQERLDNVSEITTMKEWIKSTREHDVHEEEQWKQFLLSSVRSKSPASPASLRSPVSKVSELPPT